jgi:hypothetical protein
MITSDQLLPIPAQAIFNDPDWNVWGGTALEFKGRWYRIFARWHKKTTHWGWATHSEIACAVGDSPLGPWSDVRPLLKREETDAWDAHNFHNPCPVFAEGRYWLFYTGNRGDGTFWGHRNQQRVGVAVSDHPAGPYERQPEPLLDVTLGSWDHLITACPIVMRGPDGTYRMIYKGVSEGPPPFGGTVRMGLATAPHPSGPWTKQPGTFFSKEGVQFTTDDNFFWHEGGRFHAIVKDYGRHYQPHAEKALVCFSSTDARNWVPVAEDPTLLAYDVPFADGARGPFNRVDQPQIVFDSAGRKVALCLSIKEAPDKVDEDLCYSAMMPLRPLSPSKTASA